MTKDVLISIKGMQLDKREQEPESLEVISAGEYYFRNGKHYVLYDEISEEGGANGELTKCMMKASAEQMELTKKGANNVHMVFEKGKKDTSYYNMPFGQLLAGIDTMEITLKEEENLIEMQLKYGLELNYSFVADCTIAIKIMAKGKNKSY